MTSQQTTMKMVQADFLVCQRVLDEFKRPKHRKYMRSFIEPVNIVAVPTYLNVVRQPMDLSTIAFKLGKDTYDNAFAFRADFELMLDNSDNFNAGHPPSPVFDQGIQLRETLLLSKQVKPVSQLRLSLLWRNCQRLLSEMSVT
jgi:hypothetical protein